MTEVKFDAAVLKANRSNLRQSGSSLGGQFYRVAKYAINDEYGEKIAKINANGNKDLCLNRGISRFKINANDIHSVSFENQGDGTPSVIINKGDETAAIIPMSTIQADGSAYLPATEENLAKALSNPKAKNIIFANPDDIVDKVNQYNLNEVARIDALIAELTTAKNSITQTIESNLKRAQEYKSQLRTKPSNETLIVGHAEIDA